jgi:tetratricopeptide (TPR) repeat protein
MAKRKSSRPADPKTQPRRAFPQWLPAAALAGLAIAVYANSLANGFVGDDRFQLLRNPLVKDLGGIPRIFGSGVWSFLGVTGNYYRPLQFLVYLLIYQCAGFNAAAFHLFMVLLHAGNTVLLFFFVRRWAASRIAWAAAALFAVHPVHTEPVDWIAALPDLMLTTFVLTGLLLFARQHGAPHGLRILEHCGIYLLALWTKETGVTMLPLYAGFGFFCLGRRWNEFRRNAALYAAMIAAFSLYLAMRIRALGSLTPRQHAFFHLGPADFALSVVVAAAQYLRTLLLPLGLNYFHVFHPTQSVTPRFLISAAALAVVAALFLRPRTPLVSYGIFWTAAALAPALNLTGVGQNVFTERYLYLPSAGFCCVAAWAWAWCAERKPDWANPAGAAILVVCAVAVIARNRDWHDNFTMLQVTVRQSPDSGWLHDALAGELVQRDAFDEAIGHQRLAVRYDPGMALYHKKLGYMLMGKDNRGAIAEFQKVDALEPGVAANHYDLAAAFESAGDAKDAAEEYKKALDLQPQFPAAKQGYERVEGRLR